MNIAVCDFCRRDLPLGKVTVTINQFVPGEGKRGHSEPVLKVKDLELCKDCTSGLGTDTGNRISELKVGIATLPSPVDCGTVDLTQGDVPVLLDSDQQEILLRATDTGIEPEAAPEHPRHKRGRAHG